MEVVMPDPITHTPNDEQWGEEDKMWRDAYYIVWVGAANPTAVARTLYKHLGARIRAHGTREGARHVALQAIEGQLSYLMGNSLGQTDEQLNQVEANAKRLGLI